MQMNEAELGLGATRDAHERSSTAQLYRSVFHNNTYIQSSLPGGGSFMRLSLPGPPSSSLLHTKSAPYMRAKEPTFLMNTLQRQTQDGHMGNALSGLMTLGAAAADQPHHAVHRASVTRGLHDHTNDEEDQDGGYQDRDKSPVPGQLNLRRRSSSSTLGLQERNRKAQREFRARRKIQIQNERNRVMEIEDENQLLKDRVSMLEKALANTAGLPVDVMRQRFDFGERFELGGSGNYGQTNQFYGSAIQGQTIQISNQMQSPPIYHPSVPSDVATFTQLLYSGHAQGQPSCPPTYHVVGHQMQAYSHNV